MKYVEIEIPDEVLGQVTIWYFKNLYRLIKNDNEYIMFIPKSNIIRIPLTKNLHIAVRENFHKVIEGWSLNFYLRFVLRSDYGFSIALFYDSKKFDYDYRYRYAVVSAISILTKVCDKLDKTNKIVKEIVNEDFVKPVALYLNFAKSKTCILSKEFTVRDILNNVEFFDDQFSKTLINVERRKKELLERGELSEEDEEERERERGT